jgi:hypothetical protein
VTAKKKPSGLMANGRRCLNVAICPNCNKNEYDEKQYKMCMACAMAMRKANQEAGAIKGSPADIVDGLSKINSNLYAIRTMLEFYLGEKGFELKTDKETKRFSIQKIKRVKK